MKNIKISKNLKVMIIRIALLIAFILIPSLIHLITKPLLKTLLIKLMMN